MKDFTEILRNIGYPGVVSMENFRTPNFELVADVLYWMIRQYNPNIPIHEAIESEDDRIMFLRDIAQVLYDDVNITLNLEKLYTGDGYAVKELLKVANLLYSAHQTGISNDTDFQNDSNTKSESTTLNNLEWIQKANKAKSIASEITEHGAKLHELLEKEHKASEIRKIAMKFLDSFSDQLDNGPDYEHIDTSLSRILGQMEYNVDKYSKQLINLESDKRDLEKKINNKRLDMERNKKRLKNLETLRPAFMDEYEALEIDLKQSYEKYVDRFRNLHYLEKELATLEDSEAEKRSDIQRTMKRIQKKLKQEELEILRGEDSISIEFMNGNDSQKKSSFLMENEEVSG